MIRVFRCDGNQRVRGGPELLAAPPGDSCKVWVDLEPEAQPKGAPVVRFVNATKGGVIPQEFHPAIEVAASSTVALRAVSA